MTAPMIPREHSSYSAIYVNKFEGVVHWNGGQILDWYTGQTAGKAASKP
jgi:hypothetical protein